MSVVDEIKERVDAVDLIESYLPLQKAGQNFKGLCPFHTEKTPSFVVFPDTQTWHCFGACSTGGDIFSFVMQMENVEFREALRMLADRAGITLTPMDEAERERREEVDQLREINLVAADFYHHLLVDNPRGQLGRDYFQRRGVTRQTMATFQLGFAPDDWHTLENYLKQKRYSTELALKAGLLSKSDKGNVYDRFRGRVLFPIRDAAGHVVGFGGRVLDDSVPKYLNTPQTPLFDKSSVLYGIDLARKSIRETETVVIVEGYMDVVIPYQAGVTNLVACMGTALTEEHIKTLKRLAKVLIFALDPDAAGERAVEKGIATAQDHLPQRTVPVPTATGLVRYEAQLDAEIRVLSLPDGLDPDELILEDRERWDELVRNALPVADYLFEQVLSEADLETARGKREAVERLLPVIARMNSPVVRNHYLQRLAQGVRMEERQLLPELERLRGKSPSGPARRRVAPGPPPPPMFDEPPPPDQSQRAGGRRSPRGEMADLERHCLALLLHSPELLQEMVEVMQLSGETFGDIRNRELFQKLESFLQEHEPDEVDIFRAELDTELSAHVESLMQTLQSGPPLSFEMIREDLIKSSSRLRKRYLSQRLSELRFIQQDAQEHGQTEHLREFNALIERLTHDYLRIDQRFHSATLIGRREARQQSGL